MGSPGLPFSFFAIFAWRNEARGTFLGIEISNFCLLCLLLKGTEAKLLLLFFKWLQSAAPHDQAQTTHAVLERRSIVAHPNPNPT